MEIVSQNENLVTEFLLIVKLFFTDKEIEKSDMKISHSYLLNESQIISKIVFNNNKFAIRTTKIDSNTDIAKTIKHNGRILLYNELSKLTKKSFPWGSLTGIRPTKLYYELLEMKDENYALRSLIKNYKVSKKRAELLKEIIYNQKPYIEKYKKTDFSRGSINAVDNYATLPFHEQKRKIKNSLEVVYPIRNIEDKSLEMGGNIDLYINIPFCTTKCYYCSFISQPLDKCGGLVEPYLKALRKEINATIEFIKHKNYKIKNIYVGGGTPTAISAEELNDVLKVIPCESGEFTVECGRPDTITKEKLDVLKKYNVNRISINPQTFNDETLKKIGRNHTSEDVINAINLARNYSFKINMDLIAGLADEKIEDFKNSLKKTISLQPENITVHTLSIKKSSQLKNEGGAVSKLEEVEKMVNYSIDILRNHDYKPYYLYRQKNTLGNFENIGYFKSDYVCKFNINSMEECSSVIACGANAISKRVYKTTYKIERYANMRDIKEYISRIEEIIVKKHKLFD